MLMFRSRYERAKKWQLEQKEKREKAFEEYNGEKLYEESVEDVIEKGDMFALMISGILTILPVVILLLLIIVFAGLLFMRII